MFWDRENPRVTENIKEKERITRTIAVPGMDLCHGPLRSSCVPAPYNVCFPAKPNARIVNFLPGQSFIDFRGT
jgi:hypothetical protein